MDNFNKFVFILFGIVLLILVFTIVFVSITSNGYENDNKYNNGICIKCGGSYEYLGVVGYHDIHNLYFVYRCKNCNNIIRNKEYHGN